MLTLIHDHIPDDRLDVRALDLVLNATDPALFAAWLPGETRSERAARKAAAGDIVEHLLAQAREAAEVHTGPPIGMGAAA